MKPHTPETLADRQIRQLARDFSVLPLRDARALFTSLYLAHALVKYGSKTEAARHIGVNREQINRLVGKADTPDREQRK